MDEKETQDFIKKGIDIVNRKCSDKTREDEMETFRMQKELHLALMRVFKNDIMSETDIDKLRDCAMHLYAYMDSTFGQIYTSIEINDKAELERVNKLKDAV